MNVNDIPAEVQLVYNIFANKTQLGDKTRDEIVRIVNAYPDWFSQELKDAANTVVN